MGNGAAGVSYVSLADAAHCTGVSVRTLRRWLGQGLPAYRSGPRSKVLLRPSDIDAFLMRQQTPQPDLDKVVDETLSDLLTRSNP